MEYAQVALFGFAARCFAPQVEGRDGLAERAPVDPPGRGVEQSAAGEFAQDREDAARTVDILDMVMRVGGDLAQYGHPARKAVDILHREIHPGLVGHGQQVQHRIGRAAHGDVERHGILEGCLRGHRARDVPQIEVTFDIDANGILKVSAKDKATGKEQAIRIEASSGLSKEEIEKMKAEAEANAEADKKEREKIDKLNQADSMIFSTENQLKELGDKLPADKKAPIEAALQKLKDAHKAQDLAAIDTAMAELNTAFQAASAEMYAQSGAQGGAQAGPGAGAGQQANQGSSSNNKEDIQDADFEEVK